MTTLTMTSMMMPDIEYDDAIATMTSMMTPERKFDDDADNDVDDDADNDFNDAKDICDDIKAT